jgi:hypothetical protein
VPVLGLSLTFDNLKAPNVEQCQLPFAFVVVTWQQASKHVNKSIIGATVSMYRSQCLVVSGDKEEKGRFGSSRLNPCGCGTVSTGKRGLSAAEYCLHIPENLWKKTGILFTQIGKHCLIYQSITTCFLIP